MSDQNPAWSAHLRNLDRCQDKSQRDSYLSAVERSEGSVYRSNLQRAWFDGRASQAETKQSLLATFTPPRV